MTAIEPVRLILVAMVGFVLSMAGTGLLVCYFKNRRILDRPNERSSHTIPTPRGGGIALLGAVVAAWLMDIGLSTAHGLSGAIILTASLALGLVCFIDDLKGLKALPRLLAQCAAVAPGIWLISDQGGLFRDFLPLVLDLCATGFLWLWFINLFNFMDGIDGITGVEISTIGIGIAGLVATSVIATPLLGPAVALVSASLGFLVWNWRPARIFMGDVGSIPLGYLIGWLLINASEGTVGQGTALVPCLILPAYYLSDASITLGRRLLNRKNIFRAHRQHFYQKAVIRGIGHETVCGWIILTNGGLVITAWLLANPYPKGAFLVAALIVLLLLVQLSGAFKPSEAS